MPEHVFRKNKLNGKKLFNKMYLENKEVNICL